MHMVGKETQFEMKNNVTYYLNVRCSIPIAIQKLIMHLKLKLYMQQLELSNNIS